MANIKKLNFKPLFGLSSKHLQMIFSSFSPLGEEPPSKTIFIDLGNDDKLTCEVSTPRTWKPNDRTIALLHGLGGSHQSTYLIRMARQLFHKGYKVVRINLRNCGNGEGLSKLPYSAGNSADMLKVLETLKLESPDSEITLIGFSLGGNIVLKLGGELGPNAIPLVKNLIAICPTLDLEESVKLIESYPLYHHYYLRRIIAVEHPILKDKKIRSIYELDERSTGPLWGFKGADEYYQKCSSKEFLGNIQQETHVLFAEDDPFISLKALEGLPISEHVHLWTTPHGGHMGFLGRATGSRSIFWLDNLLLHWIDGDFTFALKKE